MARNDATQWLTVADFKPGIFADYHYAAGATPADTQMGSIIAVPGAATIENTYRCCADMTGALAPLPVLTVGKTSEILPAIANPAESYPPGMHMSVLLDAQMMGDLYVAGVNSPANDDRAAVFTMYGQWYLTDQMAWTVIVQMHRLFESASAQHDLMFAKGDYGLGGDPSDAPQIGGGNFAPYRVRTSLDSNNTHQSIVWLVYGSPGYQGNPPAFRVGAMSAGDQALTDFDDINGATYPAYANYRIIGLYPDYENLTTLRSRFLLAGYEACVLATVHQARLVAVSRTVSSFGQSPAGALVVTTERVHYGPQNDLEALLGEGTITSAPYGEERSSRSGIMASISADELILIKHRGGGVMIRNTIEDPTVVQLPYINSTHGVQSIPISTPAGLVYGGRDGVYLWEGGETSTLMSQQIEGFFWNHAPGLDYLGSRGRFGWWEPWVCVPNNYLFDTRHKSWWRLDQIHLTDGTIEPINCYDVSSETNRLYAFPYALTPDNNVMWYNAVPDQLASSYSWQSQPMCVERDRVYTVKEIRLLVTPSTADSTVAVTVVPVDPNGVDGAGGTVTFDVDAAVSQSRPQMLHKLIPNNFHASYIQIRLLATAASGPAPKIHSVSVGVVDRANAPQQL